MTPLTGENWPSNRYNLYQFSERFIIEPVSLGGGEEREFVNVGWNLEIDRFSTKPALKLSSAPIPHAHALHMSQIDGVVGILQLLCGHYLIVVTQSASVGTVNGAEIFRVAATELIPFSGDSHLNENEQRANQHLVEMVQSVLSADAFYYSFRMDISHTLQWLSENSSPDFHRQPLLQRIDSRFVWNAKICSAFNTPELSRFVCSLMHGFVGIRECTLNRRKFRMALISRRSVHRAGVRFHTRGADQEGNCANFVESEQIVEYDEDSVEGTWKRHLTSFVQIRGSVPLYWSQKPNLKWQPSPVVGRQLDEQEQVFRAHLMSLLLNYGRDDMNGTPRNIVLLSLINQYGREHTLGTQFRLLVDQSAIHNCKYVAFDFHRHCSSLNWDRLAILKSELEPDVRKFGFFCTKIERQSDGQLVEASPKLRRNQNGFFRTNCMDCLDRTNVVQAMLGLESLRLQLQHIGVIEHSTPNFDAWPEFIFIFKNLWADNGDDCSKQYAGTPALKTDYTRIGKRTMAGAMADLQNSLARYFKNNFMDGYRQDAINLFLGNCAIDGNSLPERIDHSLVNFDANGAAIAGAVFSAAMTILCILVSENLGATLFWSAIFAAFSAFIWVNGDDFVDRPLLRAKRV